MNTNPFSHEELQVLLDEKADLYNRLEFIETDPISVPHRYSDARDIEIAGFLAATIAWGQRVTLIRNANWLLDRMDNAPADFIRDFSDTDLKPFEKFVHRTFNGEDCLFFLRSLQRLLSEETSFENLFRTEQGDVKSGIIHFRKCFLGEDAPSRTSRHVSNPDKNSAAKRINILMRVIKVVE